VTQQLTLAVGYGAGISGCGRYRWTLVRPCGGGGPVVCWIMCNPSTADAEQDDPTIRRCIRFSRRWGFGSLIVVNLFALRATDPAVVERTIKQRGLLAAVGVHNDYHVLRAAQSAELVVAAWGALLQPWTLERGESIRQRLAAPLRRDERRELWCLGKNSDGSPKHPLARSKARVPDDVQLTRWP